MDFKIVKKNPQVISVVKTGTPLWEAIRDNTEAQEQLNDLVLSVRQCSIDQACCLE